MPKTVQEFICENGLDPVLEALSEFKSGNQQFHEFAEQNDIDEESWFEFGWTINRTLSGLSEDIIPLVDFNYRQIERVAEAYVEENAPVEWSEIVETTADEVPSAAPYQVNGWLEMAEVEEDEDRQIVDINCRQ